MNPKCNNCPLSGNCHATQIMCTLHDNNPDKYKQTIIDHSNQREKKLPGILEQAKNLTSSIVNHIVDGMREVSDEVQKERLSICEGCEYYSPLDKRCLECGCFLEMKTKWASEHCPLNPPKWDVVKENTAKGGCGCGKKNKKA